MPAQRLMPSEESRELIDLTRQIAARELLPVASDAERQEEFPREIFRTIGAAGLLSLPFTQRYGGGEQPAEVYLQVFEELGTAWASIGVGASVHALACFPLATFGSDEQRDMHLAEMLSGEKLGAYCLSESHAGSDPAAMRTRANKVDGGYVVTGTKAWTTHGGEADFYTVLARTSDDRGKGISCFLIPAESEGLSSSSPEEKMGLTGSTTTSINFDEVFVPTERRIGAEGQGLSIAFAALDAGRLGIAAVATGLAQRSLDLAVSYARERTAFGKKIIEHDGLGFLLADMEADVASARATYLAAARMKDAGHPFGLHASIAKLVATDNAMRVTTNGVQVLGGAGYTRDFPAERYMREAKVMQIFEGTNQIQRLVISRQLARG